MFIVMPGITHPCWLAIWSSYGLQDTMKAFIRKTEKTSTHWLPDLKNQHFLSGWTGTVSMVSVGTIKKVSSMFLMVVPVTAACLNMISSILSVKRSGAISLFSMQILKRLWRSWRRGCFPHSGVPYTVIHLTCHLMPLPVLLPIQGKGSRFRAIFNWPICWPEYIPVQEHLSLCQPAIHHRAGRSTMPLRLRNWMSAAQFQPAIAPGLTFRR